MCIRFVMTEQARAVLNEHFQKFGVAGNLIPAGAVGERVSWVGNDWVDDEGSLKAEGLKFAVKEKRWTHTWYCLMCDEERSTNMFRVSIMRFHENGKVDKGEKCVGREDKNIWGSVDLDEQECQYYENIVETIDPRAMQMIGLALNTGSLNEFLGYQEPDALFSYQETLALYGAEVFALSKALAESQVVTIGDDWRVSCDSLSSNEAACLKKKS